MGRPKGKEDTLLITSRLNVLLVKELDDLREVMSASRTTIIKQCLNLGITVLKKRNPEIVEELKALKRRRKK